MPAQTEEELEREAEENRRKLLAAEVAVLLLLFRRRNEAVQQGVRNRYSLGRIADSVQAAVERSVIDARALSRATGISRLEQEIGASVPIPRLETLRDVERAKRLGRSYADRWLRKADGETVQKAARVANAETEGSLRRIGVTESSEAFSTGRTAAARRIEADSALLRVWDAVLDKATCPVCSRADGTIVGLKEPFPYGEPGTVHAFCRCSWTLLQARGDKRTLFIEPAGDDREPISGVHQLARVVVPPPLPRAATTPTRPLRKATSTPAAPAPGYLKEYPDPARARAYERMLESRVMPEVLRKRHMALGLKQLQAGIAESELVFARAGYRAPIKPYEGVVDQAEIDAIATGRALPPGSRNPLPPIRIGIEPGQFTLIDGRHRLEAAQLAGARRIRAEIIQYDAEANIVWRGERNIPVPKVDPLNPHERDL